MDFEMKVKDMIWDELVSCGYLYDIVDDILDGDYVQHMIRNAIVDKINNDIYGISDKAEEIIAEKVAEIIEDYDIEEAMGDIISKIVDEVI